MYTGYPWDERALSVSYSFNKQVKIILEPVIIMLKNAFPSSAGDITIPTSA